MTVTPSRNALPEAAVEAVHRLQQDGCQSVAVITKTAQEAALLARRLPADLGARLLTARSASLAGGVSVLPGYLAKGLEFDGVLVYDASADRYAGEADRGLLYAACTRAMHGLRLVAASRPSPLIKAVPTDAYHIEA